MLDSYSPVALLRAVRVSTEGKLRREMISRVGKLNCALYWEVTVTWSLLVIDPLVALLMISMFRQRRAWLGVSPSVEEYVVRVGCGVCAEFAYVRWDACVYFTVAGLIQYITSHRKLI
jgi:hypothetical protein